MRRTVDYNVVYDKYFKSSKSRKIQKRSEFSSFGGGKLSPYDDLIKEFATKIGWDWRFLAAMVFRESKFDPNVKSWAGAVGLMQVLPRTGKEYGITKLTNPTQNLEAGTRHIEWLEKMWKDVVLDSVERRNFVLASYNVGHGHVFDARRLTIKYGADRNTWGQVAPYLLKKSNPAYYNDSVVEYGYCRGIEPVNYVNTILQNYGNYMAIFPESTTQTDTINDER
jgi:membrane-bound lytic murein transglycosylase F